MKSSAIVMTGICLATLPLSGYADLGPIVITPTRTEQPRNTSSATVYVLDRAAIETSGATTTSDLLRGMPGVQIDDLFGNGTDVNIGLRGFSTTANANTLVLVNGRRLNHSDTAGPDLHHLFPRDIERIEVMAGSAGALYGDQAVGGVINIITRRPADSLHHLSARVGSFDYGGIQFTSSMQISESLGYRFSAETFDTDHYRDNNAEENINFSGIVEYQREDYRLFLEAQEIRDEMELPGALSQDEFDDDPTQINPAFANDFINEDTSVYRLGYELELGRQSFSIDATSRETDADVLQSFRNFPSPEAGFTRREYSSINPKLYGTLGYGKGIPYVIGIDLEENDYELNIPFLGGAQISGNDQKNESLYLQVNPRLSEMLQLTLGMRSSSVENDMTDGISFPEGIEVDDDVTVAELGLAYFMDDSTRISVRLDENFRFAKVNELAFAAPGDILDTQTGESFEIGIDLVHGNQQFIATIYRLDLENEIDFDPVNFVNINLDDTRRDGLTLSWLTQFSAHFALKAEIGLIDSQFRSGSFEGNEIPGVSDTVAKLRGDQRINDFVTAYLEYHYSSARYPSGDLANELEKIDSISVYNAGVAYQNMTWEMSFRVNNLFDEKYAEFVNNFGAYFPSPERNFMLTAGYSFE